MGRWERGQEEGSEEGEVGMGWEVGMGGGAWEGGGDGRW